MKKALSLLLLFLLFGCSKESTENKPLVLVSIPPYKYFVEKVAGDLIDVKSIVDQGVNSHTFEPSPRDVGSMKGALLWFQIGEPFEKKIQKALSEANPNISFLNLNDEIELLNYQENDVCIGSCSHNHMKDLHTWLNPLLVKTQSREIYEALAKAFPEHRELFNANYQKFSIELEKLDTKIHSMVDPISSRAFLTSHPSFGYFAAAFRVEQISVEIEGKDPLPRDVEHILSLAKEKNVQVALMQPQFSSKGIKVVAAKLEIPTRIVDPYAEDYPKAMLRIASILKEYGDQ